MSVKESFFGRNAAVSLAAACVVLLPFGRTVEVAVVAMAVGGLVLAIRHGKTWYADPWLHRFTLAFALLWVGALWSLLDAVNFEKSASVVAGYLRFLLAGWFMVIVLRSARGHQIVFAVTAWAVLCWSVDVIVQGMVGRDVLGYPGIEGQLNGLFGTGAPKFGFTAALLLPLVLAHIQNWSRFAMVATLSIVVCAVVLSGRRAAWLHLVILAGFYFWIALKVHGRKALVPAFGAGLFALTSFGLLYASSADVQGRVDNALHWLMPGQATEESHGADSVGHRVWIWRAARNMIEDNAVNGVGVRGFRNAFLDYAETDDPNVYEVNVTGPDVNGSRVQKDNPIIAMHSHHIWIEILAETGVVGGGLFLASLLVIGREYFRLASVHTRPLMLPWGLCLAAGLFPLNTHLAFYSSFWAQLMWWLVGGFFAASAVGAKVRPHD